MTACRDEAATALRSSYTLAISARSRALVAGREDSGGYRNYGERMYVEGVMEQRRKEKLVRCCCCITQSGGIDWRAGEPCCGKRLLPAARLQ